MLQILHITYWMPTKLKCNERVYNYYGDISEKDEAKEQLVKCGYEYEIEILEEEPLDHRPLD